MKICVQFFNTVKMIEVFKTNVTNEEDAQMLLGRIHDCDLRYKANFDLDDCDHILRVECKTGYVGSSYLIQLLDSFGFYAEVLPDDDSPGEKMMNKFKILSYLEI
ncbi:MAG TPA: hypothetical protein VFG10_06160 [Saprospiraceae bacterium]|nr:hypothetical protein [Saprospiraceae bacterium]